MAKKTQKRKIIGLSCENCDQRHHYTVKNTQNTPDKIALRKYCPTTRSYTTHTETSKSLGRNVVKPRKH
jgi:large subunit ribosomal protein L33